MLIQKVAYYSIPFACREEDYTLVVAWCMCNKVRFVRVLVLLPFDPYCRPERLDVLLLNRLLLSKLLTNLVPGRFEAVVPRSDVILANTTAIVYSVGRVLPASFRSIRYIATELHLIFFSMLRRQIDGFLFLGVATY